jgi:hypothetical protein
LLWQATVYINAESVLVKPNYSNGYTVPVKRRKPIQVNLRMTAELKEAAEQAAADDHRSLTSLVEKLLTDYCRSTGHLPREATPGRKAKD